MSYDPRYRKRKSRRHVTISFDPRRRRHYRRADPVRRYDPARRSSKKGIFNALINGISSAIGGFLGGYGASWIKAKVPQANVGIMGHDINMIDVLGSVGSGMAPSYINHNAGKAFLYGISGGLMAKSDPKEAIVSETPNSVSAVGDLGV